MDNNLKRYAIIAIYSFPIGLAATNRILAYSKGMVANGSNVDIYIPFPTDRPNSSNYANSGSYQGVNYYYSNGKYSSKVGLFRALSVLSGYREIIGIIATIKKLLTEHKKSNYTSIIISTDWISYLFIYSLLAKYLKISSIFIFDEFPIPIRHKLKDRIPLIKQYLFKKVLANVSAYISISKELQNFYNNIVQKKTFILSIIVDISRFEVSEKHISNEETKNICYMGNMELSKDNVDIIIEAFALLSDKHPNINFNLYGVPSEKTYNYLHNLIVSLNLTNRVLIKGRIDAEQVPLILSKAYILVSSQPDTKRASGGFPTKLGEYLASGVPALLTDVGENSSYVNDGVHVFFTKPNDPEAYAKKMEYIINNYDVALQVAKNGKSFIRDNYSHIAMGQKIIDFIDNI